jgi:hypothetical protein
MSEPKYVFDTNIFINLKNKYPSDIFTSLWEQIEMLFENGVIISSDEVIEEIKKGNDDLENWINERKASFYPSNEPIQILVREILGQFSGLVTGAKKPNAADPFLIALARQMACTVVTEENRSGSDLSPKIPNIRDFYNVRCIKFFEFLRENRITS